MFRLIAALSGAPTAAKEGIFTPSLMSFILSLTPSSVLYCFQATLWETQWATSHPCLFLTLSLFLSQGYGHIFCDILFSKAAESVGNIQNYTQSCLIMLFTLNVSSGVKSSWLTVTCLRCNSTQQPILFLLDVSVSCFFSPSHLSSLMCCQRTARRQGIGAG